jgi:hypothetical protein
MQFLHQLTTIHPALLSRPETTVKIENPPYMSLTVENIGLGPRGLPALSICHYGELNGDLMRDPEMCFEMEIENGAVKEFHPYYYRNDYVAFEQFAVDEENRRIDVKAIQSQREMAQLWDSNLAAQGFLNAHTATLKL